MNQPSQKLTHVSVDAEDDEEPEPEAIMELPHAADVLSFIEAEEALRKLKLSCPSLGISDESAVLLDRFGRALRAGKGQARRKRGQPLSTVSSPRRKRTTKCVTTRTRRNGQLNVTRPSECD